MLKRETRYVKCWPVELGAIAEPWPSRETLFFGPPPASREAVAMKRSGKGRESEAEA